MRMRCPLHRRAGGVSGALIEGGPASRSGEALGWTAPEARLCWYRVDVRPASRVLPPRRCASTAPGTRLTVGVATSPPAKRLPDPPSGAEDDARPRRLDRWYADRRIDDRAPRFAWVQKVGPHPELLAVGRPPRRDGSCGAALSIPAHFLAAAAPRRSPRSPRSPTPDRASASRPSRARPSDAASLEGKRRRHALPHPVLEAGGGGCPGFPHSPPCAGAAASSARSTFCRPLPMPARRAKDHAEASRDPNFVHETSMHVSLPSLGRCASGIRHSRANGSQDDFR
jgi:hypothetical protein